jgi:thiol-disulfide isomerase/thioredoxin
MVSLQAAVLALAVFGGNETVLLDFYADWCGPCQQMDATVQQLTAKGYPVYKVNLDQQRELAQRFRVTSIPCYVMLVEGREVARETGRTSFARLEQMCRMGGTAGNPRPAVAKAAPPPAKTGGGLPIPVVQLGTPMPAIVAPKDAAPADAPEASPPTRFASATRTQPDAAATQDVQLLASAVRLRIEDAGGHSCGSGTIIDARDGQALILTCGHIFRDSQGKGRIEVDLFGPNPAQKIPGRLIGYDEKRDVGLVSIHVPGPVVAARVAAPDYRLEKGAPVVSVGCNHGQDPTARRTQVVSIDRYTGPPNLQVADQPVEGRSGGGLFTADGQVIGVCNAADPADREGFFAALGAIQAQLDEAKLGFVYQDVPPMPKRMPRPPESTPIESLPAPPAVARGPSTDPGGPAGQLGHEEQAALDEIRRRQADGSEVIVIVRPLANPQAKSEILVLNRASTALLEKLAAAASGSELRPTSLAVPRPSPGDGAPADRPAPPASAKSRGISLPPPIPMAGDVGQDRF